MIKSRSSSPSLQFSVLLYFQAENGEIKVHWAESVDARRETWVEVNWARNADIRAQRMPFRVSITFNQNKLQTMVWLINKIVQQSLDNGCHFCSWMPSTGHNADGGIKALGYWKCTVSSKTPKLCSSPGSKKISTPEQWVSSWWLITKSYVSGMKLAKISILRTFTWPKKRRSDFLRWKKVACALGGCQFVSHFTSYKFIDFCRSTSVANPVALMRGHGMSFSN